MKATIIIPLLDSFVDDMLPRVLSGALTKEEIIEETREEAYEGQAIREDEGSFLVTFTKNPDDVPDKDEKGEIYRADKHAVGDLTYEVFIVDVDHSRANKKIVDADFHKGIEDQVAQVENRYNPKE